MRTTVHLEEDVLARARQFIPRRGLSRLINEALAEKLTQMERRRIEAAMKEGYLATQQERSALNQDWGAVDVEGWPA